MNKETKVININGALVAFYPIEGLRAVGIDIRIRAGSWYEKGTNWGMAHLLEHMMFQGSEKFENHDAMEVYKEEHGIWNNAWTSGSQVQLSLRMLSESLLSGLDLAEEMLFKMTIPEPELERQRKVVGQEYEDRVSRPSSRFWEQRIRQLFGSDHLYTRNGIGNKECFETVTRKELLQFAEEMILPSNMVIGVAGKFDEKAVTQYLTSMLSKTGKVVAGKFEDVNPKRERLVHFEPNMTTATVEMDWLGRGMEETTLEERIKIGIGSYLFGGSGRSVLFKIIREKLGLAYSARSGADYYPTVGLFGVSTSVKAENVDKVIAEVKKLLSDFVKNPIENAAFERAKKYLWMQRQMSYESAMGTASSISSALFWEGKVVSIEEYRSIVEKLNEEDVRRELAKVVMGQDPMVAVMMSKE